MNLLPGTMQAGHDANKMLRRKNGAQHKTNVKKTNPSTLVAFCSLATAFADKERPFLRFVRNLCPKPLKIRFNYITFCYIANKLVVINCYITKNIKKIN